MVTVEDVAPIARYRHAHTSCRVSPPPRGRRTFPLTARGAVDSRAVPGRARLQTRECLVRIGSQRRDGHQPDECQTVGGLDGGARPRRSARRSPTSTPPRCSSPSRLTWMIDAQRLGPAAVVEQHRPAARASASITLVVSTECAAYAQPAIDRALLRWIRPTMCQRMGSVPMTLPTSAALFDASCSRDSPKSSHPKLRNMITSVAGKNLVIGSN